MQQKYFLPLGGQEKEILVYDSNNASFTYVAGEELTCVVWCGNRKNNLSLNLTVLLDCCFVAIVYNHRCSCIINIGMQAQLGIQTSKITAYDIICNNA